MFATIPTGAGIDSVRVMMNTTAKRSAFIAAALATMKKEKFDGCNQPRATLSFDAAIGCH